MMKRGIEEMSVDISDLVVVGVNVSSLGFTIQLDESTDVAKCCQLLDYAHFIDGNALKNLLLLSQELSSTTKGKDILAC